MGNIKLDVNSNTTGNIDVTGDTKKNTLIGSYNNKYFDLGWFIKF